MTREAEVDHRALAAEIAEKVMGWSGPLSWVEDEGGRDPYLFPPDTSIEHVAEANRNQDCLVPPYSTDIRASWLVVEKMNEEGWDFYMRHVDAWTADFVKGPSGESETADADTAPLAICVAALEATRD